MQNKTFTFTAKTFQLAVAAFLAVLIGVGAINNNNASAFAQASPELASAVEARQELAKIPTASIARVSDAKQREALQRVVAALQAVANNKSQAREAALINEVNKGVDSLAVPLNPTRGTAECFSTLGGDFKKCQTDCKGKGKRFCGCVAGAIVDAVKCIL